jgi:hypothetical protein
MRDSPLLKCLAGLLRHTQGFFDQIGRDRKPVGLGDRLLCLRGDAPPHNEVKAARFRRSGDRFSTQRHHHYRRDGALECHEFYPSVKRCIAALRLPLQKVRGEAPTSGLYENWETCDPFEMLFAERDLQEAYNWVEEHRQGRERFFLQDVELRLEHLKRFSLIRRLYRGRYRRLLGLRRCRFQDFWSCCF